MRSSPRRPRKVQARKDEIQRLARERLGLTSNQAFADHLGVDVATVSSLLNGSHHPSSIVLATVIDALDVKFEDIFVIAPLEPPARQAA